MGDFGTEGTVVHEKNIEIADVVDNELLESVGEVELGSVVRAVSDFGHFFVASKATTHSVVDTWSKGCGYLLVFSSSLPVCLRRDLIGSG
jgi:hypothetical protein